MRILLFLIVMLSLSSSYASASTFEVYLNNKKVYGPIYVTDIDVYARIEEFARVAKERITCAGS